MAKTMLSTKDNPYSPFTDYGLWYEWDVRAGYHTASFLARIANTSTELSEADYDLAIELAIDEIVEENVLGLYIKLVENEEVIEQTA